MTVIEGFILGLIQGVTEFLPISSSGHLIIVREFLGIEVAHALAFDVMLHMVTLAVIVVYFHRTLGTLFRAIWRMCRGECGDEHERQLIAAVLVGTLPAAAVGVFGGEQITAFFRTPLAVAGALVAGSVVFWGAERFARYNTDITIRSGFLIGLFQVLAFIPGTSRSGITIAGGLFAGLTREEAARFTFILAIPVMAGAGFMQMAGGEMRELTALGAGAYAGACAAFIFGLLSVHVLLRFLKSHTLNTFVVYRLVLAAVIVAGAVI